MTGYIQDTHARRIIMKAGYNVNKILLLVAGIALITINLDIHNLTNLLILSVIIILLYMIYYSIIHHTLNTCLRMYNINARITDPLLPQTTQRNTCVLNNKLSILKNASTSNNIGLSIETDQCTLHDESYTINEDDTTMILAITHNEHMPLLPSVSDDSVYDDRIAMTPTPQRHNIYTDRESIAGVHDNIRTSTNQVYTHIPTNHPLTIHSYDEKKTNTNYTDMSTQSGEHYAHNATNKNTFASTPRIHNTHNNNHHRMVLL